VSGLAMLLFGGLRRAIQSSSSGIANRPAKVALISFSAGYFLLALSILKGSYNLYGAYLYVLFRVVEGAAAARFYRKVAYVLRNRSLPGGSNIRARVYHLALVFSIMLAGGGLLAYLVTSGHENVYSSGLVIYTAVAVLVSGLGVWWRVKLLSGDYAIITLLGFVLCMAGSQTFGYASLTQEIIVAVAGGVAFTVGFWGLIGAWITGVISHNGFNWI